MTVVVTGASGHIGANLVRELLGRGETVRVLAHRATRSLEGLDVEIVDGDVLDIGSLHDAFAGADLVYHLAGVISIAGDPKGIVRAVNVDGAENVARAALETGVRRMVHCSSVHAFDMRAVGTIDETAPRVADDARIHAAYDRSKAEGERRVRAVIDQGLDAVVVHPSGVMGPFDFEPSRMGRFFLMLHDRTLPALVDGGFNFVDVRDVVQGTIAAAERGGRGESYLLSGHHRPISEIAAEAHAVTGRRPPRLTSPMWMARVGTPFMRIAAAATRSEPLYTPESLETLRRPARIDNSKARRELGFDPRATAETVRDVYRWFAATGRIPADAVLGDR
jgi:nucleoside-diphosphate-sugar epimerase